VWHSNGQKKKEGNYKDNRQDGWWTYYDENGKKELEYIYEEGKVDRVFREWDEQGNLVFNVRGRYSGKILDLNNITDNWMLTNPADIICHLINKEFSYTLNSINSDSIEEARQAHNNWQFNANFLGRIDNSMGNSFAANDPSENINKNAFNFFVFQENTKSCSHSFFCSPTTNV